MPKRSESSRYLHTPDKSVTGAKIIPITPDFPNDWKQIHPEPLESEELDKQLIYNRRGLLAMLEQDTKLQIYQDFIRAFHEALRKIYAKTYDRKRSRAENNQRIDKKYQTIRSELSQCYDQESLEDFLADFLSRAGLNSSLYDHWERILPWIY